MNDADRRRRDEAGKAVCRSKKKFRSRKRAELATQRVATYLGRVQRVYRCDHCRAFHLTTVRS